MARRRPLLVLGILAAVEVAFLFPGRIRVPRDVARRGSPELSKSQELLHQLADDMDELAKMLPDEGEDDDEVLRREQAQQEPSPAATSESQALATGSVEVGQVVSGLDVGALQPVGDNQYIATVEQIQAIVNDKVQKYTAVIKSFERYINELEEELEKTEVELEKKDQTLQEEARLRQEAQAEVLKLADEREELERSLLIAQEAQSSSIAAMGGLNSQAERIAKMMADGDLTEEEASNLEESLIFAQAKNVRATQDADDTFGELQEVQDAAVEAAQRAAQAEQRQRALAEELEKMRAELKEVQDQRDSETKRREYADARFSQLINRLQERVSNRG